MSVVDRPSGGASLAQDLLDLGGEDLELLDLGVEVVHGVRGEVVRVAVNVVELFLRLEMRVKSIRATGKIFIKVA